MAKQKQQQNKQPPAEPRPKPPEDGVIFKPQKRRDNEAELQALPWFEARLRHLEEQDQQQLLALLEKKQGRVEDATDALTQHLAGVANQAQDLVFRLEKQGYDPAQASEMAMEQIVAPPMQDAPPIPALARKRLETLLKAYRKKLPDQPPLYPMPI